MKYILWRENVTEKEGITFVYILIFRSFFEFAFPFKFSTST